MTSLSLFVSYPSADADLAGVVVELIERATKLPARAIRCTGVDGHRLDAGAETDDTLRREIFESKTFIALLTPNSFTSIYVLFELGARWASRKQLIPLVARGITAAELKGPLAQFNAVSLSEQAHVLQFIEGLARDLAAPLEPLSSFTDIVDAVVAAAKVSSVRPSTSLPSSRQASAPAAGAVGPHSEDRTREIAIRKMRALIRENSYGVAVSDLADAAGISQEQVREYLMAESDVVLERKPPRRNAPLYALLVKLP